MLSTINKTYPQNVIKNTPQMTYLWF